MDNVRILFEQRSPAAIQASQGWLDVPERRRVLLAGVLLGIAALSLAMGYVVAEEQLRLGLLLFLPLVVALLFLIANSRFDLLVLALPLMALTVPFDLPTGTESRVPIVLALTLALCGLWVLSMVIHQRWYLAPSPINRPLLLFGVACIISLVWGIIWRDPVLRMRALPNFSVVQIGSLLTYLASIGAALLIGNVARTEGRLKYLVGCFLFFGALMTGLQLLRIEHRIFTDNGLWGLWTVIPALGLLIAQPKLRWQWRLLLALLIAANLYQTMLVNTLWKSGWIPTLVAIFAATLLRSRRWFVVLLIAAAIVGYTQREFLNQMIAAELSEGADQRASLWETNLRVISEHWLFGTGPTGYAPYYMTYFRSDARSTHNNYLDIIAQFGIVGSALWLWLAFASTMEGIRLFRETQPGFLKTMALIATSGWIGAQASMFFGDWILPFAYNQTIAGYKYTVYSWLFLGTLISIRQIIRRRQGISPAQEAV